MPLTLELNKKTSIVITPTLAGAPGQLDSASPFEVALDPAANGVAENAKLAADGKSGTVDVTVSVAGDTTIKLVKADKNLAAGVLDLAAQDTIQAVETPVIGADGATFAVAAAPAA